MRDGRGHVGGRGLHRNRGGTTCATTAHGHDRPVPENDLAAGRQTYRHDTHLNDVTIRARVKGFLEEKHFEDGKNVKKGQLLLVIEERPYQVQLESAQAQLAAAKASLDRAIASKIVPVTKAKLALDEAQLSLDMIEERRARNLLARNAASQEDHDRAEAQRKKSAAQVESDRASLAEAEADYRIDIENTRAQVAQAQSAVENAEINLGYCRMFAPIDGRIGELKVKLGNLVGDNGDTELVNLQQLDPMGLDLRPAAAIFPLRQPFRPRGGSRSTWPSKENDRTRTSERRCSSTTRSIRRPRRSWYGPKCPTPITRSCPASTSRPRR